MSDLQTFHGPNAGYVLDLFERYQRDPASVADEWQAFFATFDPASLETPGAVPRADRSTGAPAVAVAAEAEIPRVVGGRELARSIRSRGHTAGRLDPLGAAAVPDPALRPEAYGLTEAELAELPAAVAHVPGSATEGVEKGAANAAEAIARLRALYSGSIGYEFHHIPPAEERAWLRQSVESGWFLAPMAADGKRALLNRLSQVEGFEKFLHKTFVGQKRFSIEGNDVLVPMLDEIVARAGSTGVGDVLIGMAHRGRLNVLTHVLGKPYAKMLAGFQTSPPPVTDGTNPDGASGDVKYHMGWQTTTTTEGGEVTVTLSPNPSHLEFVDPIVVGMTRAAQDDTSHAGAPVVDFGAALGVLVHGDAAFPGQGVVAETLNMSGLRGYSVGGTIHIIVNNQIGFTTIPEDDRSTRYSSDLAKGFEVPIIHVNADDAEACIGVARLAIAYREQFHKDVVIDLIGYRRWGHNEGDEPAFTQPRMYDRIRSHATVREQLAAALVEQGVVTAEEAEAMLQAVFDRLGEVNASLGGDAASASVAPPSRNGRPDRGEIETGVAAETLRELNDALLRRPEGFEPNSRLQRVLDRRRDALGPEGGIDWGHAEALAFASLLADGTPIRLTGQDAERGTFSHRHAVLHETASGERLNVLQQLPQARASFEVYNSPLSEMAVVGFEYGYSVSDPQALVLWEAQFGDFANGAQVMIDQYITASYQKWEQRSGLVLLLPHGYEGQGPEHSSARLERFLQLAAQNNLIVANCTTSAQYFHLLRRQAALLEHDPRPLVVMSPKSLLRHPLAASRLEQLAEGRFQRVIVEDDAAARADRATRLLLCSGKVYVDLVGSDAREGEDRVVLARIEELYPFPAAEIAELVGRLPALKEIVWVQEEPRNMGAWRYMQPRLRELAGDGREVRYVGRGERASPAEGSAARHATEQARIVGEAWSGAPAPARARKKAERVSARS